MPDNNGPWGEERKEPSHQKKNFDSFFSSGQNFKNMSPDMPPKKIMGGALIIGLLVWILSGFYQVNPEENALVLRFGKWAETTSPGWHYHLPYPIESVEKVKVTITNQIDIGISADQSTMITGDKNIVDINFSVQWKISDPYLFVYHIRSAKNVIRAVSESAMRDIIGQTPIDDALSRGRGEIETRAVELIQTLLNEYKAGVLVTRVNLSKVDPPAQVNDAFYEVERAYADQKRLKNEAEAYRNDKIPRARGQASVIKETAVADRASRIANSEGEAKKFQQIQKEHSKHKSVTEKRLYIETMEHILKDRSKVIMEGATNGLLPHMSIDSHKGTGA